MKKLKKLLATISAVVVCAVSISPLMSNAAGYVSVNITPYTTSFTVKGEKYTLWHEATDYCKVVDEEKLKRYNLDSYGREATCYEAGTVIYASEDFTFFYACDYKWFRYKNNETKHFSTAPCVAFPFGDYYIEDANENDRKVLEDYLTDNNVPFELSEDEDYIFVEFEGMTFKESFKLFMDIKENTGFVCHIAHLESSVQISDIENALPEKTLNGDANEDGIVDIADAAAIIQHIGNRGRYGLSIQGEANADCYNTGDGVTGMDAVAIQKLEAGLIESLDEA